MERWSGRVAVVTGASAGIGAAIAQQLLDHGVNVVGLARREDKIKEAVSSARQEAKSLGRAPSRGVSPGKLYARKCDVSKEEDILENFKWIKDNLGGVDILVNNAGVTGGTPLTETNTEDWKRQLDVNVLGLSICTREAVKSMRERGVDDGHIIHLSSILAHIVSAMPGFHFLTATKQAVKALTEGLRKDLSASGSKIRISSVSPGVVKTDFLQSVSAIDTDTFFEQAPFLYCSDIADAVLYVLAAPPHVQIHEIIVKPVGEAF